MSKGVKKTLRKIFNKKRTKQKINKTMKKLRGGQCTKKK